MRFAHLALSLLPLASAHALHTKPAVNLTSRSSTGTIYRVLSLTPDRRTAIVGEIRGKVEDSDKYVGIQAINLTTHESLQLSDDSPDLLTLGNDVTVSPDGRWVAYFETDRKKVAVKVAAIDGSIRFTAISESTNTPWNQTYDQFVFSPDSTKLVTALRLIGDEWNSRMNVSIRIFDLESRTSRLLSSSGGSGGQRMKRIWFTNQNMIYASGDRSVFSMDFDGELTRRLAVNRDVFQVTKDGKVFLSRRENQACNVFPWITAQTPEEHTYVAQGCINEYFQLFAEDRVYVITPTPGDNHRSLSSIRLSDGFETIDSFETKYNYTYLKRAPHGVVVQSVNHSDQGSQHTYEFRSETGNKRVLLPTNSPGFNTLGDDLFVASHGSNLAHLVHTTAAGEAELEVLEIDSPGPGIEHDAQFGTTRDQILFTPMGSGDLYLAEIVR